MTSIRRQPEDEFVGPCYAWWPGDALPDLPPLDDFSVDAAGDDRSLAALAGLDVAEVAARRRDGNRPYVARVAGAVAGWGWVAEELLEIGELAVTTALPPGEYYLWDFVTVERWRGRGIYPRLLQAILRDVLPPDAHCWIGHEPGNVASSRGILKAGFRRVGDIYARAGVGYILDPVGPIERARVGAPLFGAVVAEA